MRFNLNSTLTQALAISALAWGLALPAVCAAQAESAASRTSAASGVTVKVTANKLSADADVWTFAVVLDSHSQDLSDDLVSSAVLVSDNGQETKPLAWRGAPAGGHHREGVLDFAAPKPRPKIVELKIRRLGESEPRTFRWTP